jgi:glyoxylase I family protein
MALDLLRVQHCNVNCSNLEASLAFYRDFVGLQALFHTNPDPQDGTGFGIPGNAQWDAWMLHDGRGGSPAHDSPAIDLLEWKQPKPTGLPYEPANHLGMFRICFLVPDIDAVYKLAVARNIVCLSPPVSIPIQTEAADAVRALFTRDPDGTLVEFIEQPDIDGVQFIHVNVNCSNLEHSREWYERVLGLEVRGTSAPGPVAGEAFGFEGHCEYEAAFLFAKSGGFAVDLLEWKSPKPVGTPYSSANHLGIYRMAFLVPDAKAGYEELRRQGVECPEPVFLDMGPDIPVDGVWAVFFNDPDGTCLELIEAPILNAT